mgnify:CR=1 FL=1
MERELEDYILMSDYIFLFDMDSTITRKEVLPEIAQKINRLDEMRRLTEATMRGEIPFRTSFLQRVKILSDIPVHEVNKIVSEIPLNTAIVNFCLLYTSPSPRD